MYGEGKEFNDRSARAAVRDIINLIDTMGFVIGTLNTTNPMFNSLCSDYTGEGMRVSVVPEEYGSQYAQLKVSFHGEEIIDQEVTIDMNGNIKDQDVFFSSNGLVELINHLEDTYIED